MVIDVVLEIIVQKLECVCRIVKHLFMSHIYMCACA